MHVLSHPPKKVHKSNVNNQKMNSIFKNKAWARRLGVKIMSELQKKLDMGWATLKPFAPILNLNFK